MLLRSPDQNVEKGLICSAACWIFQHTDVDSVVSPAGVFSLHVAKFQTFCSRNTVCEHFHVFYH